MTDPDLDPTPIMMVAVTINPADPATATAVIRIDGSVPVHRLLVATVALADGAAELLAVLRSQLAEQS